MIKCLQPFSSANKCPTARRKKWLVRVAGTRATFRGTQEHFLSSIITGIPSREIAAATRKTRRRKKRRLHHRHRAMRISRVADSATRSARTMTNDVLPRNEKDGNFNREESRNRSGGFAEGETKSRWQDQKYPIAVITRDR